MSCSSIIFHRSKEGLVILYKDMVCVLGLYVSNIVNLNMLIFVKIILYLPSRFRRRFLV